MRAYLYFDLLRQYGAVPLITEVLDLTNVPDEKLARTPIDKIVDFICSELDQVASDESQLPDTWNNDTQNYGRISKTAALALKARTLLYAASPLYNGNTLYKDIKMLMELNCFLKLMIKNYGKSSRCSAGGY